MKSLVLVTLIGIAELAGVADFSFRLKALSLNTRDFPFFIAQYSHTLSAGTWALLPVPPEGYNLFGFNGLDGWPTILADVHFSPVKLLFAAAFEVTGTPLAVVALCVLGFLAAFAYALRQTAGNGGLQGALLVFIALAGLSPAFLVIITYDLRPVILLSPFLIALMTALVTRSPFHHLLIIAGLGLLVREEASVLCAVASCLLLFDGRAKEGWRLWALSVAYAACFVVGYLAFSTLEPPDPPYLVICSVPFLLFPVLARLLRVKRFAFVQRAYDVARPLGLLLLCLPFVAAFLDIASDRGVEALFNPEYLPRLYPFGAIVAFALLTTLGARPIGPRVPWRAFGTVAAVAGVISSGVAIRQDRVAAERTAEFWRLRTTIPDDEFVVTDLDHYMAFAGEARVLVWERLPASVEVDSAEKRHYPESLPLLREQLARRDDYAMLVSPRSWDTLSHEVLEGLDGFQVCEATSELVAVHKGAGPCPTWLAPRAH